MKNNTLFLPGFHMATLRRTLRSASQKLAEEREIIRHQSASQLHHCINDFIPIAYKGDGGIKK